MALTVAGLDRQPVSLRVANADGAETTRTLALDRLPEGGDELRVVQGLDPQRRRDAVRQLPADEAVANPAFDVTPARLISAIITERGTCPASADGLAKLYPEIRNV